jgi:hypothetical protein
MLRLQCNDKILSPFSGSGRSFYLCDNCCEDIKKSVKSIYRQCKNKADYEEAGKIAEDLGLEWGGRWKSPDAPHIQRPAIARVYFRRMRETPAHFDDAAPVV